MAVVTDNFNRANEAPLAAPWTTATGLQQMNLTGNVAVPFDVTADAGSIYNSPNPGIGAGQYSKGTLACVGTVAGSGPCLAVRGSSSALTLYRFAANHGASNNVEIQRFVAGVFTSLGTFTQAWTDGDEWTLRVSGPASAALLEVLYLTTVVFSTTDNSTISTGFVGIGHSGAAITSASVDNWEGGDIPGRGLRSFTPIPFQARRINL